MKWEVALDKIEIRDFNPLTASKKTIERKVALRKKLDSKIGKNLSKIKKRTYGKHLFIDVCFYFLQSTKLGRSDKDLDNLLKILFDVLSDNMVNGQNRKDGLGLMTNDSYVYKIKCEKKVNFKDQEGLDLIISTSTEKN